MHYRKNTAREQQVGYLYQKYYRELCASGHEDRFCQIVSTHVEAIRKGIWAALPPANFFACGDDQDQLIADIFQELCVYIANNLGDPNNPKYLDPPGQTTEVLAARLYRLARIHTLGYHTQKMKARRAALERHIAAGGIIQDCPEVLSAAEIASTKIDERIADRCLAPVDFRKAAAKRRQSADWYKAPIPVIDLGRMLCPSGCGLQTVNRVDGGLSLLRCGHARGAALAAAA